MATFYCSIQTITRGDIRTTVAAAAYRAGESIFCTSSQRRNDYRAKQDVIHSEILLPKHAPAMYADRAVLWNAVEEIEIEEGVDLAREIMVALPLELSHEQSRELVFTYVREQFVAHGMCADICIHDDGSGNPHAHIMLTMRAFAEDKSWGERFPTVSPAGINTWRAAWEKSANQCFAEHGYNERIYHMPLAAVKSKDKEWYVW